MTTFFGGPTKLADDDDDIFAIALGHNGLDVVVVIAVEDETGFLAGGDSGGIQQRGVGCLETVGRAEEQDVAGAVGVAFQGALLHLDLECAVTDLEAVFNPTDPFVIFVQFGGFELIFEIDEPTCRVHLSRPEGDRKRQSDRGRCNESLGSFFHGFRTYPYV